MHRLPLPPMRVHPAVIDPDGFLAAKAEEEQRLWDNEACAILAGETFDPYDDPALQRALIEMEEDDPYDDPALMRQIDEEESAL